MSHLLISNMIIFININNFLEREIIHIMTFSVARWDNGMIVFCFSMQGEDIIEHANA